MTHFRRTKAFPTLIYEVDCSDLVEDVKKLKTTIKFVGMRDFVSDNFYVLNNELKTQFENRVNNCLSEIEYQVPHKMTTSWFTQTKPGYSIHTHHHTNCSWSGSFYFPHNCSALNLRKKKPQIYNPFSTIDPELMTCGTISIEASYGKLIIFPSDVDHFASINETDEERYSLAMNFMPDGLCRFYDSEYNYQ